MVVIRSTMGILVMGMYLVPDQVRTFNLEDIPNFSSTLI